MGILGQKIRLPSLKDKFLAEDKEKAKEAKKVKAQKVETKSKGRTITSKKR